MPSSLAYPASAQRRRGPVFRTTNLTNLTNGAPTLTVIPETREAESSGIYFLALRSLDPGRVPPGGGLSGMTIGAVREVREVRGQKDGVPAPPRRLKDRPETP